MTLTIAYFDEKINLFFNTKSGTIKAYYYFFEIRMTILDDLKKIRRLDKQGMLQSIESFGLQCQQAWDETKKIQVPASYRGVQNILINGMGGSGLGGHVIESVFGEKMKVPFRVINSYTLPGYVNSRTLYILSSYSGTTEEILATFNAARQRRAKLLIICAGGKLAALAKRYRIPAYIFTPRFNPCNQPRMGLGYSVVGIIGLLARCGVLTIPDATMRRTIASIVAYHRKFGAKIKSNTNMAKKVAMTLPGKIPILVAAQHLSGNAHIATNQINENSKNFAAYFLISEMNHHLMEGLPFPKNNRQNLRFLFLESKLYLPKVQKRFFITKKVLQKSHIPFASYQAIGAQPLTQVMEVLLFGSYVNFYLAMLNGINPSPIVFVDYFKKQLEK
jgi:glucose/mannose-6-phosphate isomerase